MAVKPNQQEEYERCVAELGILKAKALRLKKEAGAVMERVGAMTTDDKTLLLYDEAVEFFLEVSGWQEKEGD